MRRVLTILFVAACDAGAPAKSQPPTPPIARPIDAAQVILMDGPGPNDPIEDVATTTLLAPRTRPAGWKRIATATNLPELELGFEKDVWTLFVKQNGVLVGKNVATDVEVPVDVTSFRGQKADGRKAALLLMRERIAGRDLRVAVVCATGTSARWSCTRPIEFHIDAGGEDVLFKLGVGYGSLEVPATRRDRPHHYQITFP